MNATGSSPSFTHAQTSTPEADWVDAGVRDRPELDLGAVVPGSVLILLAHPDDEALGCPGLLTHLARTHDRLGEVMVLLLTAGEGSHPDSPSHTPDQLRAIRLAEFDAALTALDPTAARTILDLGDGQLSEQHDRILAEVDAAGAQLSAPLTIVAPFSGDGHGDHETLGGVAREVGRRRAATVLEFPIWYWHWARPDDARWRCWEFLPDPDGLDRTALWRHYPSQTLALSTAPGDEAILRADFLAHFARGGDTFAVTRFGAEVEGDSGVGLVGKAVRSAVGGNAGSALNDAGTALNDASTVLNDASTAESVFDEVHSRRLDPWNLRSCAYEIAKRAALIAALPGDDYAHILEIGCSIGALSADLARRAARVTAIDASARALATARRLHGADRTIDFRQATVPGDWPEGEFDCVVLAETGFYLTREQLRQTLRHIEASTTEEFTLVLCHWRGEIVDWPLDADAVHEMCLARFPDAELSHQATADYRLDVLRITDPGVGPGAWADAGASGGVRE